MVRQFKVVVIGGILGGACAIALARRLGPGQVALLESRVLGSGLSIRHSAIVRAVNRSPTAVRMAKQSADMWRRLADYWGIPLTYQTPGALWIVPEQVAAFWEGMAQRLKREGVMFDRLSSQEAATVCGRTLAIKPGEAYFYEPGAVTLEAGEVLVALQRGLQNQSVAVFEHCPVREVMRNERGKIEFLETEQGRFRCEHVVNAAGAWSARLFARCGLTIPVALEPVVAVNFLLGSGEIPEKLPIIADQAQGFYIRSWPGSQLRMHRPRSRDPRAIQATFTLSTLAIEGADQIYSAANLAISSEILWHYQSWLCKRFPQLSNPVPLTAFRSFFDITPDLNFILGRDPRACNLVHCLGAGQAFKYAPVFGEIVAALILGEDPGYDLQEFAIQRFLGATTEALFPARTGPF